MTREQFPITKPGDPLYHWHINNLSETARRSSGQYSGSNINGYNGTFQGQTGHAEFQQHQLIVTEVTDATTYEVRYRYWDHLEEEWKTNEDAGPYILDSSEVGTAFTVDQKLTAYWHKQRGAFIPLAGQGTVLKRGKVKFRVNPDETATVIVYDQAGNPTTEEINSVRHDWITGGNAIETNHEIFIGYFADEQVWRIIGAPCSDNTGPSSGVGAEDH